MKLRIAGAALLLVCFAWLAVISGAIPVTTMAEASAEEPPRPADSPPPVTPSLAPTAAPAPTNTPAPAETPVPTPETEPEEPAEEGPEPTPEVRVIATTITGDSPLDNDTYYDIDPQVVLAEAETPSLPAEGFQILIVHTHTTEAYTPAGEDLYDTDDPYHSTDPEHSVVRVGDVLAEALSAYGLRVLHDTALHDYPSYTGSYARSGEAVAEYLAAYPGIRLVIDLHRDALGEGDIIYKTLADIDGLEAAQLMFVMGSDVNLEHPDWEENLQLALTLQAAVQARYPTLMRPIVLCDNRYNQQLSPGSLLLEVGTSGNTLAEALAAVRLFAEVTGPLLASWVQE